jgi:hypothetical protein
MKEKKRMYMRERAREIGQRAAKDENGRTQCIKEGVGEWERD